MTSKISEFIKIIGVINNVFKPPHVQRHTRIRVYKTLDDQYLCGSDFHQKEITSSRDEIHEGNCRMLITRTPEK